MKNLWVGIEIGGTKLQTVLGTATGEIIHRHRGEVDPDQGAQGILDWLADGVSVIMAAAPKNTTLAGIGVGFGGPVDSSTGRVLTSHQVSGWDGILLKQWLEERFNLPVVIENDANAAGWAEYCLGAGQGTRNFVYCNIGSGIGGALIVEGALYNGQGYGACEIGHTYIPDWTSQNAGAMDKLENLCSGWSVTRRIQSWPTVAPGTPLANLCGGDPAGLTCPMLAEGARQGDAVAQMEIEAIARGVGIALTNVITLLHPERIALGGGVALMGEVLLEPLRATLQACAFGPYRETISIVPCALEEDVVTVGALLLAAR